MSKHKTLGQVFTPHWIVAQILDLVGYQGKKILDKYILEPASGDGAFLLEIVKRYIDAAEAAQMSKKAITQGLEKHIYAVELDKVEFLKSIQSLDAYVAQRLDLQTPLHWHIYQQNTLDFYKKHEAFFDFIVGNPPYIRIHNLDAETREILKKDFLFSTGTIDIYLSFFEMGFRMLKKNALLGYITPNSYLHNSSYAAFREYLKAQQSIQTLIDFKSNKIFKGFSTYTAITIIQQQRGKAYFEYKELIEDKIKLVNQVYFEQLDKGDWSFTNEADRQFLAKLQENRTASIKDFFDVQYGFATLRDRLFISHTKEYNAELVYFNGELVERKILQKVIKGSKFKGKINEQDRILFPYTFDATKKRYAAIPEQVLKEKFPYAYQYLLKNKEELQARDIDKAAAWYEFGRSQGIQSIHHEKIVLSTLVNGEIQYYRVPHDVMMYSGLYIIKNKPDAEWKIIENTLSSEEFYRYIRLTGKDFSGGYKSITSKQIKEFKIKIHE